jgi:hypothetical protein
MNINKRLNKLVNNRRCGGCRKWKLLVVF